MLKKIMMTVAGVILCVGVIALIATLVNSNEDNLKGAQNQVEKQLDGLNNTLKFAAYDNTTVRASDIKKLYSESGTDLTIKVDGTVLTDTTKASLIDEDASYKAKLVTDDDGSVCEVAFTKR